MMQSGHEEHSTRSNARADVQSELSKVNSRRRVRRTLGLAVVAAVAAGTAAVQPISNVAAAGETMSTLDGTNSHDAASSCWEIKQLHPSSPDGQYWLRNGTLQRPEQFHCDMTTDGGGWVLIGRGREGWTFRDYGQSTPQNVRSSVDGTAAFSPGALSTDTINALLDDGNVHDLADGVRVRRATNTAGTNWQELRWQFADVTSWSWAFGGGHRLNAFTIDGSGTTGSNTKDSKIKMPGEPGNGNRGANNNDAWFTYPWSAHGGSAGFSYSGNVDGQNNATSYLWEHGSENHAIPFAQVYIRPHVTTPNLAPIPDGGVAAQTQSALLSDRPAEISGGVWGVLKVGDSEPALDTPVLAITTHGDRVYVGGKFSDVRDWVSGDPISHPYLAAFDRTTGAWISTFTPDLDGTVWDLAVVDNKLIVAGQFTNVNGESLTSSLAALDLTTGAVVPGWRASMELSGSSARPYARTLDVEGPWIYVGGNFTSIESQVAYHNEARLGRVSVSTGTADPGFVPDVDGVPYDIDADSGRVYIVGDFDSVNGVDNKGVGVVDWTNGSLISGLDDPLYTTGNFSRRYQQAVLAVGSDIWQGGSEHNTQAYAFADYSYVKGYVTSGRGGDTQDFSLNDGVVYQGSHGNSWVYHDATTWPGLANYTRTDDYKWIGAFDAATREYESTWVPSLDSAFNEGAWALHTDVDNCTWFGGDFIGGPYVGGQRQYLEGFSKFCQRDTQAPTTPTNASATPVAGGVQINWGASTDDFAGFIGYEVLRNDRVISPLVYGSVYTDAAGGTDDRYFVRAKDPAGNRSASTGVLTPSDNIAPTIPTDPDAVVLPDDSVDMSWTASTDDTGVDQYKVYRNSVEILQVPGSDTTVNIVGLGAGSHWLQVRAVDAAGNESYKTIPVRVDIDGPDTQRPSVPGTPEATYDAATALITFSWTASVDDTGVEGYRVRRNLAEVALVDGSTLTVDLDLGSGGHYLQVEAFDLAGNVSYKTIPVFIEVGGSDTQKPTTPKDLAVIVLGDNSLDVSWTASTDNVGVTSYSVLRNGVVVASPAGNETLVNLAGLGLGSHYIQVRAHDAAGNESFKTAPVLVVVAGVDSSKPSTPTNVTAVGQPDGSIVVAWDASADNVGVDSYRVLRNLVEVASVPGAELTATVVGLGTGNHYIQVQALDAAGNESFRSPPVLVVT